MLLKNFRENCVKYRLGQEFAFLVLKKKARHGIISLYSLSFCRNAKCGYSLKLFTPGKSRNGVSRRQIAGDAQFNKMIRMDKKY